MERNYDQRDLFIVPVRTLRAGDIVRDFHSEAPTYGVVKQVGETLSSIQWDDDINHISAMPFKGLAGQRADIIRLRRRGEVVGVIGSLPPEVEDILLNGPAPVATSEVYSVALSAEAFSYVRNLIAIDAGENTSATVHEDVLRAFGIEF